MSAITDIDVETVVHSAFGCETQVKSYRLEPFSEAKNGVLGSHMLLSVDIDSLSRKSANVGVTTCTFFVKSPPESSVVVDTMMDEETFQEEVDFYKEIQALMLADYRGQKWSAKCYLARKNLLVYEDLRAQGFSSPGGLHLDQISLQSALTALARFHACSLAAEAKLGKSLKHAYPKCFAEKTYKTGNKLGRGTKVGYETIVLMAEKFGLDSSLVLPHLLNHVNDLVKPKADHINVVCHGDLWKNNMMFNDELECVIVDYQILRYASPAVDVTMLLYLNTTPQFRQACETEMFEHYYSIFEETLRQNGRKIKIPSYDHMLEQYLMHRIVGMTYAALYLPGIYLKPEVLAILLNDPESLKRYYLYNRIERIAPEIDSNPEYAKSMKDILTELLDETKRILSL